MSSPARRSPRPTRLARFAPVLLAGFGLLAAGCAASGNPVNQEIAVRTMSEGERVEASCELANEHSNWTVVAPVDVAVTRSSKPISMHCRAQDGASGSTVFQAARASGGIGGGDAAYAYPERMELELKKAAPGQRVALLATGFAAVAETSRVPHLDAAGRMGYERFLAGPRPRAFAISEKGVWTRVNGARGAERVALERCQSVSGRCRLYAIDDTVVWEDRGAGELVARIK
ncbi:MAG: hypothetical protein AB7P21_23515 [Lautropia sp.]